MLTNMYLRMPLQLPEFSSDIDHMEWGWFAMVKVTNKYKLYSMVINQLVVTI